jgi:SAM-dependent methyltransferase
MEDKKTKAYFDARRPQYGLDRIKFAVEEINKLHLEGSSILDIGCGTGNLLAFIKENTAIRDLHGVDISKNCLAEAKKNTNCKTILGSIADKGLTKTMHQKFDFVLMAAVLHHLIAGSRRLSRQCAMSAIENAMKLVKKGRYLILVEPTFHPAFSGDILFYIKKIVSTIWSKRLNILHSDNNIGLPVVSYYTNKQLFEMVDRLENCRIVKSNIVKIYKKKKIVRILWRCALISERAEVTIVIQKV